MRNERPTYSEQVEMGQKYHPRSLFTQSHGTRVLFSRLAENSSGSAALIW